MRGVGFRYSRQLIISYDAETKWIQGGLERPLGDRMSGKTLMMHVRETGERHLGCG